MIIVIITENLSVCVGGWKKKEVGGLNLVLCGGIISARIYTHVTHK